MGVLVGEAVAELNVDKEFVRRPFHVSYMTDLIEHLCTNSAEVAIKRRDNFWTVGSASYKDKKQFTTFEYEKFVARKNGELINLFPDFYRFQLEYFSDLLKREARYFPDVSIPGFHCFRYCDEFTKPLARPHVDVPFNQFDWGKRAGYKTIFTHVIPVEIPEGAGMYVWPVTAEDIDQHGLERVRQVVETTKPQDTVMHKQDQMVFHSGRFVHQIKPFALGQDNKWRITLQSHAILIDGIWYLYW